MNSMKHRYAANTANANVSSTPVFNIASVKTRKIAVVVRHDESLPLHIHAERTRFILPHFDAHSFLTSLLLAGTDLGYLFLAVQPIADVVSYD